MIGTTIPIQLYISHKIFFGEGNQCPSLSWLLAGVKFTSRYPLEAGPRPAGWVIMYLLGGPKLETLGPFQRAQ